MSGVVLYLILVSLEEDLEERVYAIKELKLSHMYRLEKFKCPFETTNLWRPASATGKNLTLTLRTAIKINLAWKHIREWIRMGSIIVSIFLPDWKDLWNTVWPACNNTMYKSTYSLPTSAQISFTTTLKFSTSQRILLLSENVPNLNFTCGPHLNANYPISNLKYANS